MPSNKINCHSEERSRPQTAVATKHLFLYRSHARTVHFVRTKNLYIFAGQFFR